MALPQIRKEPNEKELIVLRIIKDRGAKGSQATDILADPECKKWSRTTANRAISVLQHFGLIAVANSLPGLTGCMAIAFPEDEMLEAFVDAGDFSTLHTNGVFKAKKEELPEEVYGVWCIRAGEKFGIKAEF